jgi:hypothetical protein
MAVNQHHDEDRKLFHLRLYRPCQAVSKAVAGFPKTVDQHEKKAFTECYICLAKLGKPGTLPNSKKAIDQITLKIPPKNRTHTTPGLAKPTMYGCCRSSGEWDGGVCRSSAGRSASAPTAGTTLFEHFILPQAPDDVPVAPSANQPKRLLNLPDLNC